MAYKFATGSVFRGDIYHENDGERNTYLDWSDNAIGLVAGGSSVLVLSGTSDSVAIGGQPSPTWALDIPVSASTVRMGRLELGAWPHSTGYGFMGHSYQEHHGSGKHLTYNILIGSAGDLSLNSVAGQDMYFRIGAVIKAAFDSNGFFSIGPDAGHAWTPTSLLHLSSSDDQMIFICHDSEQNPLLAVTGSGRVGIGTDAPSATFHAYGSVSSNYVGLIDNDNSSAAHALKVTTDGNGSGTYVLDLESQSTTLFRVRGDGRVGIGKVTSLPSACLTVSGTTDGDADIAIASKIQHIGDSDTYIEFEDDTITLYAGNRAFIKMEEAGQDKVTINQGGMDVDLQIKGEKELNLIRTIASDDRVGIATATPTSTFEISGSQAGNYTQAAGSFTVDETHYMVDYTGNGDATFTLPDVSGITGRVYHILCHNQQDEGNLTVTGSGGAFQSPSFEEGDQASVRIDGAAAQSITVVSTGGNWFVLNDNRSQEH
jgi:hypothetical protein